MILLGGDIETTGLLEPDHRIVEVYVGLWKPDGTKVFDFHRLIDPQRAIPAEAQRVHGLTMSDLAGKPVFADIAADLARVMAKATHYVGHNWAGFDGPFIGQELARAGMRMPVRPIFDTMIEAPWATPDGKKPSLKELCFACDVPYADRAAGGAAHSADYDVGVMMEAFFKARSWGYFPIEEDALAEAA